jgi:hypothetical protein
MKRIGWLYRVNRWWGDGVCEALWNAVRGRSFPDTFPEIGMLRDWEGE